MSTIPHQNDVLFGRGALFNAHPGNRRFRSIVDARKQNFTQVATHKKRSIAIDIMNEIRSLQPPGRFLTEGRYGLAVEKGSGDDHDKGVNPSILSKVWVSVDDEKTIAKVLHRLREKDKGGTGDGRGS